MSGNKKMKNALVIQKNKNVIVNKNKKIKKI